MNITGINPIWITILSFLITVQTGIGTGNVKLDHVFPQDWIPWVIGWCGFLAFVGNALVTALSTLQSAKPGLLVKAAVALAIIIGSFAVVGDARAQGPKASPRLNLPIDPLGLNGAGTTSKPLIGVAGTGGDPLDKLLDALDAKLLPDLKYALALANASGSKVTAPCYTAWIAIIETRQGAAKNADGTPMAEPDPNIVTKFEKMVELRNALQPESDFMIKCSPVASMVKKDIAGFIGVVLAGGAGIATLVPGI